VSWEQPDARYGRTAVFLLVAAIFVATALAIALVAGAASQSSRSTDDVLVLGPRVTSDPPKPGGHTAPDNGRATSPPASPRTMDSSTSRTTATTPARSDAPAAESVAVPAPGAVPPGGSTAPAATISVPEIELDAAVHEGVSMSVLDVGPGHWPGTAAPGGYGNLVIAGHRSTSNRSFARIGELAPGDPVIIGDATGSYTYLVEGSDVVESDRLDAVAPSPGHILTLIAAHPPGSERYRYVVRARLASAPRPPGV